MGGWIGFEAGAGSGIASLTAPLRILQVVDTLAPGGRERLVVDLANGFLDHDLSSFVCETRSSGVLGSELAPDVVRLELGRRRTIDVSAMKVYAAFIRRYGIDVVYCHGRAVAQFAGVCKFLFRLRVPHIFHDHLPGVDETSSAPRLLRLAVRYAMTGTVVVSEELERFAIERLGVLPSCVWRISNGVPLNRFREAGPIDLREEFDLPSQPPVLISVANVRPQKDFETLLRAVARLRRVVSLVVVGSEGDPPTVYAHRCRELCTELGLDGAVRFAGQRTDVARLLKGADLGVLSSINESGPLVVAEYAAAGLPIVTTASGDISLGFRNVPGCEVVPSSDPEQLAAAMDRMLDLSPRDRHEGATALRSHCAANYSLDVMVDRIIHVFAEIKKY